VVDPLGREQEPPQLGPVEAAGVAGMDLGSANVLGRVGGDPAVDVGEAVVAAHGRQPPVDGRCGQAMGLHGPHVQLDLGASGLEDVEPLIGRPLEERTYVVAVGVQRPPLVAGKERRGGELCFVGRVVFLRGALDLGHAHQLGHWNLPHLVRFPANLAFGGCARRLPASATQGSGWASGSTWDAAVAVDTVRRVRL
jgi:hypothetical protein